MCLFQSFIVLRKCNFEKDNVSASTKKKLLDSEGFVNQAKLYGGNSAVY